MHSIAQYVKGNARPKNNLQDFSVFFSDPFKGMVCFITPDVVGFSFLVSRSLRGTHQECMSVF